MSVRISKPRCLNVKTMPSVTARIFEDKPIFTFKRLFHAFQQLRNEKKAPGPDKITFESKDLAYWEITIKKIAWLIKKKFYRPGPTREIRIEKPTGGQRSLQVPNHRDKIPQRACLNVLNELIDLIFLDWSYGFRPRRNHVMCLEKVRELYGQGFKYACCYDITNAFDSVIVRKLLRIVEGLNLNNEITYLTKAIILGFKPERLMGLNQGESLSGLLFNLYIHHLHDIEMAKIESPYARILRYADDLIVLGTSQEAVDNLTHTSISILRDNNLVCKKEETVCLKDKGLDYLGLTLTSDGTTINFDLTKPTWASLDQSLEEAHSHPNPVSQINLTLKGWRQATHLVTWTEEHERHLNELLWKHGLLQTP